MRSLTKVAAGALTMACLASAHAQTAVQPTKPATPPAATQSAPAASGQSMAQRHGQPQAKTKEEFAAYQTAVAVADPTAATAAADDFSQKYPQSELRYVLYSTLLQKFYAANQSEKVIDTGHKLLTIEPQDAMALIMVATATAETTHDTDIDQEEKYAEVMKDAGSAIKNIDTGLVTTPQMSADQVAAAKRELLSMAHAAMGYVELNRKNYGLSEQHFKDAIAANPDQPDSTNYLRLAVAQDNQQKYTEAIANADKALQLGQAENNPAIVNLSKNEKDRLTKLAASAPKSGTTAPPK